MTNTQKRMPVEFYHTKMKTLLNRLKSLMHFLEKAEKPSRRQAIQKEIDDTRTAIKHTELDSNFAKLEE
jgi:hypothetical protein